MNALSREAQDRVRAASAHLASVLEADLLRLQGAGKPYVASDCTVLLRAGEQVTLGVDVHECIAGPLSDFLAIEVGPGFEGAVDMVWCRAIAAVLGASVQSVGDELEAKGVSVNRVCTPYP
jgi:hypothetical protein